MYGLIGKMIAALGQRDALIAIMLDGIAGMPGCLNYIVVLWTTRMNLLFDLVLVAFYHLLLPRSRVAPIILF